MIYHKKTNITQKTPISFSFPRPNSSIRPLSPFLPPSPNSWQHIRHPPLPLLSLSFRMNYLALLNSLKTILPSKHLLNLPHLPHLNPSPGSGNNASPWLASPCSMATTAAAKPSSLTRSPLPSPPVLPCPTVPRPSRAA